MSGYDAGAPTVAVLRAAVREAMGTRSVREVAAEIGISHTGLRGFLNGATPHDHTRRKIERWLARSYGAADIRETAPRYAAMPGRNTYELARAAFLAVVARLGPDAAERAGPRLDALLRELFTEAGREPPPWLD